VSELPKRCRHNWRYEESAPGLFTIRVCLKCGLRQTWGYAKEKS
jgi:hypothetical protein